MALSIAFSITLYRISDAELSHGLRRPGQPVFRETSLYNFDMFREARLNESRESLKANLVLLNIITLAAGCAASYLLARKTLEPIAEAMESQARFTADASHELRTPLTAMQTEIEVALRDKKLSEVAARELLESNLEEVVKLRMLADGLLRLAQHNGEKLTNTSADLADAVQLAIEHNNKQAVIKNIAIENSIAEDIRVKGDTASIAEVISILIDNALKYSKPKTTVTIGCKQQGSIVTLTIKDQGMGISAKDLPYIFDRFYRADESRAKQDIGGYGLGLSIAKKIVDLHDGTIEVTKTSNRGTTFAVTLHKL